MGWSWRGDWYKRWLSSFPESPTLFLGPTDVSADQEVLLEQAGHMQDADIHPPRPHATDFLIPAKAS